MATNSSKKIEIYIRLLEEGTDCFRPTDAEEIGNGLYRVLPIKNYDPTDEIWEFPPESIIKIAVVKLDGKSQLLAINPDI